MDTSRRLKISWAVAAALFPLSGFAIDRVPEVALEPFSISHGSSEASDLDLSFLLDAPAGKHGFIGRHGDHLTVEGNDHVRFWGVNVSDWTPGSVQIPAKADAARWARTLARLGVNVVRLTFLDFAAPRGLIDPRRSDTRSLDPAKLDDFDNWTAELKRNGIYIDINLLVGRTYKPGDGVTDAGNVGWAKALAYFDPQLILLQKEFARELLTHRNPYTGLAYADDPAVAVVELVNENSLWDAWYYDRLHPPVEWQRDQNFRPTPQFYSDELDQLYTGYLKDHVSAEDLSRLHLESGVPSPGPIPRMKKAEWPTASALRMQTEAAFIIGVEKQFFADMRRYMRDELHVHSLLLGSSDYLQEHSNNGMLEANTELDLTDGHVYWEHPSWEGALNTPMVNTPLASTVVRLSRAATAMRPYTVTEFNNPWPNDWECEGLPIAAAYGSFQDWSALMVYSFEPKVNPRHAGYVGDAFDISHHPVKIPQMMAGALMFLRGDVSPARQTVVRTYSKAQVAESIRLPQYEAPYYTPGFPVSLALEHKVRISSFDGAETATYPEHSSNPIRSDTGELAWYTGPTDDGLVTVDSPRSQALIGFVKANGLATRNLSAQISDNFCALTLSSLGPEPIAKASRLLLTAGARVSNTGFKWLPDRTNFSDGGVGTAPSLIEVVSGHIGLIALEGAASGKVQALDGAGAPLGRPLEASRTKDGWEFPVGQVPTTWYEIYVDRSVARP